MDERTLDFAGRLASQLRVDSTRCTTEAASGRPISSLSAADDMAVLLVGRRRYDWQQDLPDAVGVCVADRYLDHEPSHAGVLCGDGETAEGSVWEELDQASHYQLGILTAIVNANRLGQRGPTELEWELDRYARRADAFGARALVIDGHDLAALDWALNDARADRDRPTVILARTVKAKAVPAIESKNGWHGWALPADIASRAVAALGGPTELHVTTAQPQPGRPAITADPAAPITWRSFTLGDKVATRNAFGAAITALAARPEVVVLDGEVGKSTDAQDFAEVAPDRYFKMFIAEQQMVAPATRLAVRGYRPFASTFAFFLSRAFSVIRVAGISQVNICLVGSHAGVDIGQDGPSQMALEDLAALRAVHGSVVLYPADGSATVQLAAQVVGTEGIVYLRTTRGAYPVIDPAGEPFPLSGCKVHRAGPDDQAALIGAAVTLHECLAAAEEIAGSGIPARVIDLYSIKPLEREALVAACHATDSRLVIAEDPSPCRRNRRRRAGSARRRRRPLTAGSSSGGQGYARLSRPVRIVGRGRYLRAMDRRRRAAQTRGWPPGPVEAHRSGGVARPVRLAAETGGGVGRVGYPVCTFEGPR
jgi:transketolase